MLDKEIIRIGTRGSKLALTQAREVAASLAERLNKVEIEIVEISTKGDRVQNRSLSSIGGTGLFVKEIERALLEERVDLAVHSMKDLPTEIADGLTIAAVTKRLTPFDVLISADNRILDDLPAGAVIGTSSPRRVAQLLSYRPDLEMVDARGNLDTRMRNLDKGKYQAIVVAAAGVERLGLQKKVSEIFTTEVCVPAPGQGALAIQVRSADKDAAKIARKLMDHESHRQIKAERAFLKTIGGGCTAPLGALCIKEDDVVTLEGLVASPDGVEIYRDCEEGASGEEIDLGVRLAERLLEAGAGSVLKPAKTNG
jgi:hydroxymethylbilane synthase